MAVQLTSESVFRRIADTILSASKAEHTFVSFSDSESSTLRFANDQVTQNVSVRTPNVSIRVAYGQRHGGASTNRLDEESLIAALRHAEAIARLAPEDPEYLPPLGPQKYLSIDTYRRSTANAQPMDLARMTKPAIDCCVKESLVSAGILSNTVSATGVAASSGLFGYEQATDADFSLTATGDDSTGWCSRTHRDIRKLRIEEGANSAVRKALLSRSPRELEPGHYPVILEPAAVAGVFGPLLFALDAKSYYRGNSALADKLGSQILDSRLTLESDPTHPDLLGDAFDGSGMATRKIRWVENGKLVQLAYDRFTAKEKGVEPTPRPGAPVATFAGPTGGSVDDLIAKAKRAILITNFWYIRSVDPKDLTITGMTRDGTFLVENGKIVCGVKNFRFHDSPLRCFQNIEAATVSLEAVSMERGKSMLPAVYLPDFHLSSVTKF